jgi:protein tyrosine/serine phosphatase
MKELEALGVKTVVNLRSMHSDEVELRGRSLDGRHIVFNVFEPKMKQVIRFLLLAGDPARHPVFVHCKHGADRTGMMVAFYRIVYQGWTKKQAIREMTAGGFGFHSVWGHLVSFIRKTDVKKLERFVKAERGRRSARATGGGEARGEVVDGPGNGGSR